MKIENQMLSRIINVFGKKGTEVEMINETKQVVEAVTTVVVPVAEGVDTNVALEAALTEQTALNATLATQVAELTAKLVNTEALLDAWETAKAEAQAIAVQAKLDARKEKIVAAIGTDKADALMSATEGLDDAKFDAIVNAMALSVGVEAKTEMFNSTGVETKTEAATPQPVHFNKFIKKS